MFGAVRAARQEGGSGAVDWTRDQMLCRVPSACKAVLSLSWPCRQGMARPQLGVLGCCSPANTAAVTLWKCHCCGAGFRFMAPG